ncbi:hypothetical protein ACN9UU_11635 [Staphylococcus caprae]|uniref:Phage protein n=3 Tax=Staphylococcus TaxID=1279 RepID=A0ABM7FXL0_9STAP|nr:MULTISPECIES: hypothetical protein [Staphylococcus]EES40384.1 hypothetical protein HMPREF0793_1861 [Staphylococcus caprae M23864:W1]MBN6825290.1 hypothetical protein [Staphylococcus caprae]MDI0013518.1 hypothetical protein [Staphylococcus caprae]MEB8094130.1 hypothetical protein [Staphylococcus caprae]PAK63204.1 hypothetical protein B9K00_12585 [Staphylococcus caprae]
MDELVKMTFSDGNGNVLREGYVAVTNEFLEQINVENHSITSPEYVKELKRKARAFDEIVEIYNDVDNFSDSDLIDVIEDKMNDLESDSDVES